MLTGEENLQYDDKSSIEETSTVNISSTQNRKSIFQSLKFKSGKNKQNENDE
jgi:hypothetical protein